MSASRLLDHEARDSDASNDRETFACVICDGVAVIVLHNCKNHRARVVAATAIAAVVNVDAEVDKRNILLRDPPAGNAGERHENVLLAADNRSSV